MANNQPADEQAAGLPILSRPGTGQAPATSEAPAASEVDSAAASSPAGDSGASPAGAPVARKKPSARREPRASVTIIGGERALSSVVAAPLAVPLAARPSAPKPQGTLDAGEVLGARSVVSVLLVSDALAATDATSTAVQTIHNHIVQLGHAVEIIGANGWQSALSEAPPEVILFDPGLGTGLDTGAGHPMSGSAGQACRNLKEHTAPAGSVLVVLLPGEQSDLNVEAWTLWQQAGADVVLEANASPASLQGHLELWSRLVRLQRDANALRDSLGKQVQIDDLTQLLNRRYFFQAAHREVSRSRRHNHPLACLMVDINHFKIYNKTFGYACGDHILRTVAATIRAWTRESDIVARFGAKKFVLLLPETDVEGAMVLHEKLQNEISDAEVLWEGQKLPLTISIGEAERHRDSTAEVVSSHQALTPEDELRLGGEGDDNPPLSVREELADLLEDADAALYVAKKGVRYPNFPTNPRPGEEVVGILGSS